MSTVYDCRFPSITKPLPLYSLFDFSDVVKQLRENGKLGPIRVDKKNMIEKRLECNKCSFTAWNMPSLKAHLPIHINIPKEKYEVAKV